MASKTVERSRLFSYTVNFQCEVENDNWFIYYHDPNGMDMYKIQLDVDTKTLAKNLKTQLEAWMATQDIWSGNVVEHWQKQVVHRESDVEDWVLV